MLGYKDCLNDISRLKACRPWGGSRDSRQSGSSERCTWRNLRVFSSFITWAILDSVILFRPVRSWIPVLVQPTGQGLLPMHS